MKPIITHFLVPALMPALFFRIAFSPVNVLGCRTRGLLALSVAFASGLAAIGTAIKGAKSRARGEKNVLRWTASTLILVLPVIAFLLLA
jgi:hypothetical protein